MVATRSLHRSRLAPAQAEPEAPAPKRERRKEARPGELLVAALDLFVEKGFAATRADEVAARAGVSKGTLFLYFDSKEDLFKAVVRENIAGRLREGVAEAQSFEGTSAELVHLIMQAWWDRFGATKASGICKLMMTEASNFPDLAQFYVEEVIEPMRELIKKVIGRGVKSGEFRALDLDYASYSVIAPVMYLVFWRHSGLSQGVRTHQIDPVRYLSMQANMVVQGLLVHPQPQQVAA